MVLPPLLNHNRLWEYKGWGEKKRLSGDSPFGITGKVKRIEAIRFCRKSNGTYRLNPHFP